MGFNDTGFEHVECLSLQNIARCRDIANTAIDIRIAEKVGNFLTNRLTAAPQEGVCSVELVTNWS